MLKSPLFHTPKTVFKIGKAHFLEPGMAFQFPKQIYSGMFFEALVYQRTPQFKYCIHR